MKSLPVTEKITRMKVQGAPEAPKSLSDKKPRPESSKLWPAERKVQPKKKGNKLQAERPREFLLKGKARPETAKVAAKLSDLTTTEKQDAGMDLQKILKYYRDRAAAHERDRQAYLEKMEKLRVK